MNNNNNNSPTFILDMIVSILLFICCCHMITGGVSLIFTLLSNKYFREGCYDDYKKKHKIAVIAMIIGWVTHVLMLVIALVLYALGLIGLASMS